MEIANIVQALKLANALPEEQNTFNNDYFKLAFKVYKPVPLDRPGANQDLHIMKVIANYDNIEQHHTNRQGLRKQLELYLDDGYSAPVFYNSVDNLQSEKKKCCEYCGEFGSWEKAGVNVKHSKKNCPYNMLFGWDDMKQVQYIIRYCNTYIQRHYKNQYKQMIIARNKAIEISNENTKSNDETIKLIIKEKEDIEKELKLFHRIMPEDTIKSRIASHNMMLEEIKTKSASVEEKIKSFSSRENTIKMKEIKLKMEHLIINKKCVKIKRQYQKEVSDMNNELRKTKSKNNFHKNLVDSLGENVKILEKEKAEKDEEINYLENEKDEMLNYCKMICGKCDENEAEMCIICQEDAVINTMRLSCGHIYHSKCFLNFCLHKCRDDRYKRTYECPLCKKEILKLPNY